VCLGIIIGACGDNSRISEDVNISFSDLTAEDIEIVAFVNENSDYEYVLLDEMAVTEKEPDAPYTEVSDDGNVECYGFFVAEKKAIMRTQINLKGQSQYNILGIHNGDTYQDAKTILEGEGFKLLENNPYGSDYTRSIFEKGAVQIRIRTKKINDEKLDDDTIETIGVSVPVN